MKARNVVTLLALSLAIVAIGFTGCTAPAGQQAAAGGGSAGNVTGGDGSGGDGTAAVGEGSGADGSADGGETTGAPDRTGTLRVLVTDKPFPFEFISEALVTITRVEAKLGRGDDDTDDCEGDDDDGDGGADDGDDGDDDADDDDDGDDTDDDGGDTDDGGDDTDGDGGDTDDEGEGGKTGADDEDRYDFEDDGIEASRIDDDGDDDADDDTDDEGEDGKTDSDEEGHDAEKDGVDDGESDDGDDDGDDDDGDDGDDTDDEGEDGKTDADEDGHDDGDDDADSADDDDDDSDEADDSDDAEDSTPFVVLFEGERTFDLLELRNGRTDLLAEATIPAGNYKELRLIVTEGQITLTDGSVFPLTVPSGEQTGIKLKLNFEVAAEEETVLLLDIDLSRAFSAIPSGHIDDVETIRGFKFSPSIAMRLIELAEAATISGTVTDPDGNPLADVSVTAFDGETEVTGTATDADGTYALSGLPAGTYRLQFTAPGFQEAELTDRTVEAGQTIEGTDIALIPDAE
ncbi:MAG: DUF4382 domain-containing protein [Planctomycetes bacterium]|nr:DUF4382 domain-containing protein [Planctomycetota bacterium]